MERERESKQLNDRVKEVAFTRRKNKWLILEPVEIHVHDSLSDGNSLQPFV